mgnify:CR=1 FL=1
MRQLGPASARTDTLLSVITNQQVRQQARIDDTLPASELVLPAPEEPPRQNDGEQGE